MKILFALLLTVSQAHASVTQTKLALNWKAEPEFGGFYTAKVAGQYKANNLEVEILQGGAGTPTVQMIASGQVDFGIVSGDEIAIARSNGADVVALFAVFQKSPYALMLHEESPYNDIKSLMASRSTISAVKGLPFVSYLKKKFGFNVVKWVPYTGGITNFLADKKFVQQCFISSEPLLAAKQGVKVKTFLIADSGFNPYTVVLATNGEMLKKNPDLVRAMVKSVKTGWGAYLKDPIATHAAIAKLNPAMTMESMAEIHKVEAAFIESDETKKHGLGSMTVKRWKELAAQMKEIGLTPKEVAAKDLFRTDFLQ